MKRTVVVVVALMMGVIAQADLNWNYTADLRTFDATIQTGWLMQMYHDVDADSVLSEIRFDPNGATAEGTGHSDDVLLGAFTTTLTTDKGGNVIWGQNFIPGDWAFLQSEDVYSVLFNAATINDATHAVIIDASPFTLPGVDPATYSLGSVNNTWHAIPEPATALMLIVGGLGAFIFRRSKIKSQQEEEA